MTLITKRDIQASRSHHSRHTERRIRAAGFRVGSTRVRTQMIQFCASATSAGWNYSEAVLGDIDSLLFGQTQCTWMSR